MLEDHIEICDHIFMFNSLKLGDKYTDTLFEQSGENSIKVWEPCKTRKKCEICESQFAGAAFCYETPQVMGAPQPIDILH